MNIRITSKMKRANAAALRNAAEQNWRENNAHEMAFAKFGRNTYGPIYETWKDQQAEFAAAHNLARHMMVVAGQTFDYVLEA